MIEETVDIQQSQGAPRQESPRGGVIVEQPTVTIADFEVGKRHTALPFQNQAFVEGMILYYLQSLWDSSNPHWQKEGVDFTAVPDRIIAYPLRLRVNGNLLDETEKKEMLERYRLKALPTRPIEAELSMTRLNGVSADALPPLDDSKLCQLATSCCEVYQLLSQLGVLHGDVKPANLIVDLKWPGLTEVEVMPVDFGVGWIDSDTANPIPRRPDMHDHIVLTPGFASPEQHAGKYDLRSEIFAMGATALALSIGPDKYNKMFNLEQMRRKGIMPVLGDIQQLVAEEAGTTGSLELLSDLERRFVLRRLAEMDPGLKTILSKCLRFDPDGRYQSFLELANDISRVRTEQPQWQEAFALAQEKQEKAGFTGPHVRVVPKVDTVAIPVGQLRFQPMALGIVSEGSPREGVSEEASTVKLRKVA